jgi:hypothetical protein
MSSRRFGRGAGISRLLTFRSANKLSRATMAVRARQDEAIVEELCDSDNVKATSF